MKPIYSLALSILILFVSCKKDTAGGNNQQQQTAPEPSIASVTWSTVWAGANPSIMFKVKVNADSNLVNELRLFEVPMRECDRQEKPNTGITYTMYDPGNTPTNSYYFFIFYKNDGTKIKTEPFKVY